jgi:hypothetical protein
VRSSRVSGYHSTPNFHQGYYEHHSQDSMMTKLPTATDGAPPSLHTCSNFLLAYSVIAEAWIGAAAASEEAANFFVHFV